MRINEQQAAVCVTEISIISRDADVGHSVGKLAEKQLAAHLLSTVISETQH